MVGLSLFFSYQIVVLLAPMDKVCLIVFSIKDKSIN